MDFKNHHKPLGFLDLCSWLFPLTYLIHVAEEYWCGEGYPAYILRVRGVHLSSARFLAAQALGTILMAAGILLARRFNFPHMMLIIMSSVVLVNGLTHTMTSWTSGVYGPGLLSSALIWIPLSIFCLVHFKKDLSRKRYAIGVAIGVSVNVMVFVITMRGARLV
jgi:dolichyl-phosphate-mannose--protein O-mannosyl transferase